jgi:hypothetical protein
VGNAANGQVRRVVRQRLEGLEDRQKGRQLRREGWQEYYRIYNKAYRGEPDKTYAAVDRQLCAMGVEIFEVGALQRGAGDQPHFMLLRTWDKETLINSIPWLRYQNWHESHIYVRPKGESNLTLIDDLKGDALARMREEGFEPAVVVETSPGSYQVWIKHPTAVDKEMGTAVARELAARFGGDVKAADWRHFGRLSGFRNTKEKHKRVVAVPDFDDWRSQNFHRDLEGQWVDRKRNVYTDARLKDLHANLSPTVRFPFVRLVEASGAIARESERLVAAVRAKIEQQRADRAQAQLQFQTQVRRQSHVPVKGIDAFRRDPRYDGDGTRVDLAYAVYAVARGVDLASVRAALCSRDLSHKGDETRQRAYIDRTIKKALASVERGRGR